MSKTSIKDTELSGVVLAGGRSTRMGTDKALMVYRNLSLIDHAVHKLSPFCKGVFISVNEENARTILHEAPKIPDLYPGEGPISGILSSLKTIQSSILVMACDMPLITVEDIVHLITHWDREAAATMYFHHDTGLYEPLLAIWNYAYLDALQSYYDSGFRSLKSFARQHPVRKIEPPDPKRFANINENKDWVWLLGNNP